MKEWKSDSHVRFALIKHGRNSGKKKVHTEKRCLLCEDLVPVECLGKVNLILVLYTETHQS